MAVQGGDGQYYDYDPVTQAWTKPALPPPAGPSAVPGTSLSTTGPGGGAAPPGGPEIIPPSNSTIPPGKSVAPFTNPWTDAATNQLAGGMVPGWLQSALKYLSPLGAASSVFRPTELNTGELPLSMAGGKGITPPHTLTPGPSVPPSPSQYNRAGPAEINVPLASQYNRAGPAEINVPLASGGTGGPFTPPMHPSSTGLMPSPSQVNLGTGMPASPFAWINRPNADPLGGARGGGGSPMMSALDLSGIFNHPAVQAALAGRPVQQPAVLQKPNLNPSTQPQPFVQPAHPPSTGRMPQPLSTGMMPPPFTQGPT
jgi:hypothetical protein